MAWNDLTSGQQFGYGSLIAQGISNTIQAFGSFGINRHQNAIAQSQANIARLNAQMMATRRLGCQRYRCGRGFGCGTSGLDRHHQRD